MTSRLQRTIEAAIEVPRDLLLGRYPAFVTGGALPRGHVPVFVFHGLEPESFGRKLRYLADNGYVTLGGDEYFQVLMGARPAPERAVVLTFDDGRGTLWGVGRPLLKLFGMKGIVFLVPGRIRSRGGPLPPDWDDARRGTVPAAEVLGRDEGDLGFLSWEEIDVLARERVYEFQSHTLSHARIHTSGRFAGFVTPAAQRGYAAMDVPWIRTEGGDRAAGEVPLGTPFYESQPRTSDAVRFIEEPGSGAQCVQLVADEGGAAFFEREGWEGMLRRWVGSVRGRLETPAEAEAEVRRELAEARELIRAHTGAAVTHLCYPWHSAGARAQRIAAEVGYVTAFHGKVRGVPLTVAGGDPLSIARVGEDYVELLPGRNRMRLRDVLREKTKRRLGSGA